MRRIYSLLIVLSALIICTFSCKTSQKNNAKTLEKKGIRYDDTTLLSDKSPYLMPYNRIIDGAGTSVTFGNPDLENHSLDLVMLPNTPLVVVEDRYGLAVFNTETKQLVSRWTYAEAPPQYRSAMSSFSGIKTIVFKDSSYIFWGAGGRETPDSYVIQAVWDGKKVQFVKAIVFNPEPPAKNALPNEVFLQIENGELFLYTVLNGNNEAVKINVNTEGVVWKSKTGVAPFGLQVIDNQVFVTNWAGSEPKSNDERETAGVPWGSAYINPKTGAISEGTVTVFDAKVAMLKKK